MIQCQPPKHAALLPTEYRCAVCGDIYTFARSHEECLAEEADNFGGPLDDDDRIVVCDDCYVIFMDHYEAAGRPPVPRSEQAKKDE
jgi:hypothetical protein